MTTFVPSHTARLDQLKGMPLASCTARAAAFVIDFLLAFLLFLAVLIYGSKRLILLGLFHPQSDINLKFDLQHWYSILFVVLYFGLCTYWGHGQTPGKWLLRIRVVSLTYAHLSLWHALERAWAMALRRSNWALGFCSISFTPTSRRYTTASRKPSWSARRGSNAM